MNIRRHDGDREALRPLFRLAEDSERAIDASLHDGEILTAHDRGEVVGHAQLVPRPDDAAVELTSLSVVEGRRRAGVGRALVEEAVRRCRDRGTRRLLVATATASVGNLRFYQRLGFRMLRVERDAFVPETGYPAGITIEGIPLRDRIWFDRVL